MPTSELGPLPEPTPVPTLFPNTTILTTMDVSNSTIISVTSPNTSVNIESSTVYNYSSDTGAITTSSITFPPITSTTTVSDVTSTSSFESTASSTSSVTIATTSESQDGYDDLIKFELELDINNNNNNNENNTRNNSVVLRNVNRTDIESIMEAITDGNKNQSINDLRELYSTKIEMIFQLTFPLKNNNDNNNNNTDYDYYHHHDHSMNYNDSGSDSDSYSSHVMMNLIPRFRIRLTTFLSGAYDVNKTKVNVTINPVSINSDHDNEFTHSSRRRGLSSISNIDINQTSATTTSTSSSNENTNNDDDNDDDDEFTVQIDTVIIADHDIVIGINNDSLSNINEHFEHILNITSNIFGTSITYITVHNISIIVLISEIISTPSPTVKSNIDDDKGKGDDIFTAEAIALLTMIIVGLCCASICLFCCIVFCCRKNQEIKETESRIEQEYNINVNVGGGDHDDVELDIDSNVLNLALGMGREPTDPTISSYTLSNSENSKTRTNYNQLKHKKLKKRDKKNKNTNNKKHSVQQNKQQQQQQQAPSAVSGRSLSVVSESTTNTKAFPI